MKPIELKKDIYWVGGIDWDLRNFHGYLTQRGSTYNAYLIIDEKITLIDTVKEHLTEEMLERISHIIDPAKIDVIVTNHIEMDHSGAMPCIMEKVPNATMIASTAAAKNLPALYHQQWDIQTVKTGDTFNIGKRTLSFVATPMVHWPDNMVTYSAEDKILFSNDAFGQHLATQARFDDEYPLEIILEEARKYYANIVLPFGVQVKKALAALEGVECDIVAPSHGVIWRKHISAIMAEYVKWADNQTENKATIVYDTMWESTHKMAKAVASAFEALDIPFHIYGLQETHISDIMTDIITSKYICVGTPTINNNLLPTAAAFLAYLRGLKPLNRTGLSFGSYGWGGQSIGQVHDELSGIGFDMLEPVKHQYVPDADALTAITNKITEQLKG